MNWFSYLLLVLLERRRRRERVNERYVRLGFSSGSLPHRVFFSASSSRWSERRRANVCRWMCASKMESAREDTCRSSIDIYGRYTRKKTKRVEAVKRNSSRCTSFISIKNYTWWWTQTDNETRTWTKKVHWSTYAHYVFVFVFDQRLRSHDALPLAPRAHGIEWGWYAFDLHRSKGIDSLLYQLLRMRFECSIRWCHF